MRVSTRRMYKLVTALGITGLIKSQVSVMAADLDEHVESFRTRPLDAGPYPFVAADAQVLKVREGGRVLKVSAPWPPVLTPRVLARQAPRGASKHPGLRHEQVIPELPSGRASLVSASSRGVPLRRTTDTPAGR